MNSRSFLSHFRLHSRKNIKQQQATKAKIKLDHSLHQQKKKTILTDFWQKKIRFQTKAAKEKNKLGLKWVAYMCIYAVECAYMQTQV